MSDKEFEKKIKTFVKQTDLGKNFKYQKIGNLSNACRPQGGITESKWLKNLKGKYEK